ncbi:MAG: hypothetical protein M5U28_21425 [Sandaracinaceae bacterium]|nr:hypothetical protein [Sandaracinaceae bacterium]
MPFDLSRVGKGPGLLIVEGNAERLRRERHTQLSEYVVKLTRQQVEAGSLRLMRQRIRNGDELESAKAMAHYSKYPAAMIVAHGGPFGVEVAPDITMSWADVADAIAPTQPRYLLAVACFGGVSMATDTLFDRIPSLERIVGSPAPLTVAQARAAVFELTFAAYGTRLPAELSYLVNMINAMSTNGVLYTRTRDGRNTSSSSDRAVQDLLGLGAWALLQSGLLRDDDELVPEEE